jgi:hypothetical protein
MQSSTSSTSTARGASSRCVRASSSGCGRGTRVVKKGMGRFFLLRRECDGFHQKITGGSACAMWLTLTYRLMWPTPSIVCRHMADPASDGRGSSQAPTLAQLGFSKWTARRMMALAGLSAEQLDERLQDIVTHARGRSVTALIEQNARETWSATQPAVPCVASRDVHRATGISRRAQAGRVLRGARGGIGDEEKTRPPTWPVVR